MIRALAWKELREQGVIVGALIVLGASLVAVIAILNPTARDPLDARQLFSDPGTLALFMLTMTAGVVIGGTLFAAEKENGTQSFLEMLPVPRWKIWLGKMLAGAGLTLSVTIPLLIAAAISGILGPLQYLPLWALGLIGISLTMYSWGTVGSMVAKSSLAAAGLGILFAGLGSLLLAPFLLLGFAILARLGWNRVGDPFTGRANLGIDAVLLCALFLLPIALSLFAFTAPDRNRKLQAATGPLRTPTRARRPWWSGLRTFAPQTRAAAWLVRKQFKTSTLVLLAVAFVCGFSAFIPAAPLIVIWPAFSLLLSLLVGVIGWYDEQASGSSRFWLERRLPVGRLWRGKFFGGLLTTILIAAMLGLPMILKMLLRGDGRGEFASRLLAEPEFPLFSFYVVWPAYGFAFGHLLGLIFRKTIVAAGIALLLSATFAVAWLPSLLSGGLHTWQVFLPLIAIVITARILVWFSVAERIGSHSGLSRLALGGLGFTGLFAIALGYRMLEIPDSPDRKADLAFRNEIPPFEDNKAGQELRRAAILYQEAIEGKRTGAEASRRPDRELTPTQYGSKEHPLGFLPTQPRVWMESAFEHGWRGGDAEMEKWFENRFANGWADEIRGASRLTLGTLEDPVELTLNSPLKHLQAIQGIESFLLLKGLRDQAEGHPQRFLDYFSTVLNLSRNVRNKSIQACAVRGRLIEQRALLALSRWLESLDGNPELIRAAMNEIDIHDLWCRDDSREVRLADQVVLRNTLAAPGEVLKRQWHFPEIGRESERRILEIEVEAAAFAWQVPWEQERHDRIMGQRNGVTYQFDYRRDPFSGMPGVNWWPVIQSVSRMQVETVERSTQCDRHAARTMLAIRLFELEQKRVPNALEELVPKYLPGVPLDPFGRGKAFNYRVSLEEIFEIETRTLSPLPQELPEPYRSIASVVGGVLATDPISSYGRVSSGVIETGVTRTVTLSPGTPVVWSLGKDGRDSGGTAISTMNDRSKDRVYVRLKK